MGFVCEVRQMFTVHTARSCLQTFIGSQLDAQHGNWFFHARLIPSTPLTPLSKSTTTPKKTVYFPQNKTSSNCVFDLFLYKKGTIYITFIKSFSIIKYNITLLQKFQIPATIQDKLPIRVHTVSFFHFNFFFFSFLTTSSPSCANNSDKTRLNFLQ